MLKKLLVLLLCVVTTVVFAIESPVKLLSNISNELVVSLNKDQEKKDVKILSRIVEKVLLPHVDKSKMAQAVIGRQYWIKSSVDQRSKFIRLFTLNIIKTYAGAIENYHKNKIVFYPISKDQINQNIINVKSSVESEDSPRVNLVYSLLKINNNWKIIDFSIDGVSLVNSYRAQFRSILVEGGLKLLNKQLDAKLSS
jgi:phospholipid transport system substrate-binding protein